MTTSTVVVTGMGVKTPAGCDLETFWQTLLAGRSTAGPIIGFDTSDHPVTFACEVRDFDPEPYLGVKEARRADRVAQLGFAAAADALADAGDLDTDPARCAVVAGTGVGGLQTLEAQERVFLERGAERVSPFFVPMMMPNAAAALVAMRSGFTGPNICVTTACAAGAHAIGEAARLVRDGSADVVVAGGAEAAVTPVALAAFWRMGALSGRSDDPTRAARPFDVDRDGFVMGEGAAFVVLESLEHALTRGARIWGEVAGYGRNCDAFHITAPSPSGAGAAACMQTALEDAGVGPDGVSHVNAHGTSTPLNDEAEASAIVKVFGENGVAVTGTKGVTGHLVGAAGAAEAVASLLALNYGLIPPTANHERTDPALAVDVVAGEPRPAPAGPVLSNSFGFGGHNASLVLTPASEG
ncbi:MAG: beta-ketoacyl-ACP synthase [Acidimicrobiales bacterium]|nr:beta-ketoacyl-ACP synthase [Acidimicrobiales bacterium]